MVNRYITFELLASELLVHFDRRCTNVNSTWRKISDAWRMVWVCCCCPCCCRARVLGTEPIFFGEDRKQRCRRNQKQKKMAWKKKVDLISGVPLESGEQKWLAWRSIYCRNHSKATSIISKFICWKYHETRCAIRKMVVLTVQTDINLLTLNTHNCVWNA